MASALSRMARQNLVRDQRILGAAWNQTYGHYFSNQQNTRIFSDCVAPFLYSKKNLDILYATARTGALGEMLVRILKKKKIGDAPKLVLTQTDHVLRYDLTASEIKKIQKIIQKVPFGKRPCIQVTSTGYCM